MTKSDPPSRAPSRWMGRTTPTLFVLVVAISLTLGSLLELPSPTPALGASLTPSSRARLAPRGNLTTTSGQTVNLDSLLGTHPTMVWFVVAGCASCSVSIPAVTHHLAQLSHDHVRVVVLDLYGDLGSGRAGAASFGGFAKAVAGKMFANPIWIWGVASKSLSIAYDPSGTPDEYFFVNAQRRVVYQNSVPVSTMAELLTEARSLRVSRSKS